MATTITAGNGTNGGANIGSDTTGILEIRTGTTSGAGTTAMTVDASQNVGIGTSSPASRLDVRTSAAEIGRFSSSATNGGYQIFYPDNVTTPVYVGSQKSILGTGNATDFAIVGTGANNMVFGTSSTERARIDASGMLLPGANATYDLGSTSLRWRNVYTSDLHLSNGIGNYTIVEGEEDLFLYNNKNGKTYKFALIEVDKSEAPPKMKED